MATDDNAAPTLGFKLLMPGAGTTVKLTPLLAAPPTAVTTTLPLVALLGTVAVTLLAFQLVIVAAVPLNVTPPWDDPKFDPAITIDEPTAPELGVRLLTIGGTVNTTPLLSTPLA